MLSVAARSLCVRRCLATNAANVDGYTARNEPVLGFLAGSPERRQLEKALDQLQAAAPTRVPICIGDEEIYGEGRLAQVSPFQHSRAVAKFDYADSNLIDRAVDTALRARASWDRTPWQERARVFLRAADMIAGERRGQVLAATMLGQAKTVQQAEIDAAPELVDFLRFNVENMGKLAKYRPICTAEANNSMHYRACEGFWAAVSPFNFTAIGGNLAASPAFAGNVVVWKPTDTAILSNYVVYKIFREAGLPPGVINFVPADGPEFGRAVAKRKELAGVNFTGSVATFRSIWKSVADNIEQFRGFPRLIGECGGKNFHFLHSSADVEQASICTIRSAFEYSGQKCSACSRMFVPASLWPRVKERLLDMRSKLKFDSPLKIDETYSSAVIDANAFRRISGYVEMAKTDKELQLLAGGECDDSVGFFVQPTIVQSTNPRHRIMREEIFGPVLTVYVYEDSKALETLRVMDAATDFALTGAVFAEDANFVELASRELRDATGNFYVNVMSTGSVVGQQPFGGARLSGTNDKAGGPHYLLRFSSPQSVKTQTQPVSDFRPPQLTQA